MALTFLAACGDLYINCPHTHVHTFRYLMISPDLNTVGPHAEDCGCFPRKPLSSDCAEPLHVMCFPWACLVTEHNSVLFKEITVNQIHWDELGAHVLPPNGRE